MHSNPLSLHRLSVATAIGSTGLGAAGTAGALLAVEITGEDSTAGLPLGALAVGAAVMAVVVSRLTYAAGRARALTAGYAAGLVGGLLVTAAAVAGSLTLTLAGSVLLGGANAGVFLARYAAADLAEPPARGRALGRVFLAAAAGAVAGPNLLGPAGQLGEAIGLPRLAGPYLLAVAAFVAAALVLAGPRHSRRSAALADELRLGGALARTLRIRPARLALLVLAAVNLVMVGVMAVAPLTMTHHGHGLGFVGVAVGAHVLGMFAPSPLTGRLADRFGGGIVAGGGLALLALTGLAGRTADMSSGWQATALLLLLGLGWNAGVVGGSVLLVAALPVELRPQGEGLGEAAMGLAAATGAPAAGLVSGLGDFTALGIAVTAVASLALVALSMSWPSTMESRTALRTAVRPPRPPAHADDRARRVAR